jgi:hypothetical protein
MKELPNGNLLNFPSESFAGFSKKVNYTSSIVWIQKIGGGNH